LEWISANLQFLAKFPSSIEVLTNWIISKPHPTHITATSQKPLRQATEIIKSQLHLVLSWWPLVYPQLTSIKNRTRLPKNCKYFSPKQTTTWLSKALQFCPSLERVAPPLACMGERLRHPTTSKLTYISLEAINLKRLLPLSKPKMPPLLGLPSLPTELVTGPTRRVRTTPTLKHLSCNRPSNSLIPPNPRKESPTERPLCQIGVPS